MRIKSIEELNIPSNLKEILTEKGYWEEESFDPLLITVEGVEFMGEEKISYQVSFDVFEEFEDVDGDEWEEIVKAYIKEKEPNLESKIHGDSEGSTCVVWVDNEKDFRRMMEHMSKLLQSKDNIARLIKRRVSL